MVDHVNTTPHPEAINMQDLVVDAPVSIAKPGEQIPRPKVKKITALYAKQSTPLADVLKEKAAQFAPTLTQPLASMPPTEQDLVQSAPVAQTDVQTDAPHYFNHVFILEQLENLWKTYSMVK
jgi:hypothetical protein